MSAYLKVSALPSGLNYLKLSDITVAKTVSKIGGLLSYINYKNGKVNDLVNSATQFVGTLSAVSEGVKLSTKGFVNTNIAEMTNFTAVAIIKPTTTSAALIVSTFTHETYTGDGVAGGVGLSNTYIHARQQGGNNAVSMLSSPLTSTSNFYVVGFTRNGGNITVVTKTNTTINAQTFTCTTATQTKTPIGFGSTINSGGLNNGVENIFVMSALHNKSMTQAELTQYVNDIAAEFGV